MAQHPPIQPVLEIDVAADSETDSVYQESIGTASYVSSLSSSIRDYKYENGRRYHAYHEGTYIVPNDEEEQDRMDLLHHIYRLMLGGELYTAPIGSDPQRVLDIGTGTGIWAIQFAEQFPSAQVIGTDLSPIQPTWVPPNCTFEVDDFESSWIFHRPFDFIHGRELEGCVADEDKLFREAFQHLKPGGIFELDSGDPSFLSDDGTHEQAKSCQQWLKEARAAASKFGKPLDTARFYKEKMENAGFVEVTEFVFKVPLRPWAKDPKLKEIGKFQQIQELIAMTAYTPALFSRVLGWTQLEMEVLLANVRNELKDKSIHMYAPIHFVYGRKPLN